MTRDDAFKDEIRARMERDSVNYTTARRRILDERAQPEQLAFGGPGQHARTILALELMAESHLAHQRGDRDTFDQVLKRAYAECGFDTLTALEGGMRIGEIPKPHEPDWGPWLDLQRTFWQCEVCGAPFTPRPGSDLGMHRCTDCEGHDGSQDLDDED